MKKKEGNDDKLKKIITLSIICLMFLYLVPIIIYCLNFNYAGFSDNIEDWVYFSNFISGILSPLFALVNIILLIVLTIIVYNWETERNEKAIEAQKILATNKLKYDAFIKFADIKNNFFSQLLYHRKEFKISIFILEFRALFVQNKKLFEFEDIMYTNIKNSLVKIKEKMENITSENHEFEKELTELISNFQDYYNDLLSHIEKKL